MFWRSNTYKMFCKQEPGRGIHVCFCLVPSEERQARSSSFPETGSVSRKTKVTNVTSLVSFSSAIFFFSVLCLAM